MKALQEIGSFIAGNWATIVLGVAVVAVVAVAVVKFCSLAAEDQESKIKEWLLYAVTMAEAEFGGGTGRLKLASVYDAFVEAFPFIKSFVPLTVFDEWVDDVLVEMRHLLQTNESINEVVTGPAQEPAA